VNGDSACDEGCADVLGARHAHPPIAVSVDTRPRRAADSARHERPARAQLLFLLVQRTCKGRCSSALHAASHKSQGRVPAPLCRTTWRGIVTHLRCARQQRRALRSGPVLICIQILHKGVPHISVFTFKPQALTCASDLVSQPTRFTCTLHNVPTSQEHPSHAREHTQLRWQAHGDERAQERTSGGHQTSAVRPLMKIASSPSSAPMLMDTCMPPHRLGARTSG